MRILVDTSIWVDFLNGYPSLEQATLAALLKSDHDICTCGVVIAEVFQGLRRDKGREGFTQSFRELIYLDPSGVDLYFRAAEIYRLLRARGLTVRSTIDCLIAALAEESGAALLARDRDMKIILESGLVRALRWPVAG
ncbi:MAG TPA: PIN domain nuclease [Thermoanaerobaculia bacterium]|nr:PIN domain nuclease [Thermoanaerobaculia bacterium]